MLRHSVQDKFISRFIKGVLSIGIGTALQIILGFIGLMVAVRFIEGEQLGIFVLLQVIASFFLAFSNLALQGNSVTKFIATAAPSQKTEIASTALCYNFIFSLGISLVVLVCRPLIYNIFKSQQLSQLVIYIPLMFFLNSFYDLLLYILQGFHKYKMIAISQIINGAVRFLLILIFLIGLRMDLTGLIYAFCLSFLVPIIIQYLAIPRKKRLHFDHKLFLEMLKFGFPLGLNRLLTFIFSRADRLIIGSLLNPVGVAYYDIASKLPENGYRLFQSFESVFFPNMSELLAQNKYTEAEQILNNSLRIISFITMFGVLITLFFQEEIVRILFSDQYLKSAPAIPLLMLGFSIGVFGNVLGTSLVAFGQSDKPLKVNILDTATNVSANLIMIPILGFMGAVYATIISRSVASPLNIWFLRSTGLKVNLLQQIKIITIFVICWVLFNTITPKHLTITISFVFLYLILSFSFSIINKNDFLNLYKSIIPRLSQSDSGV